MVVLSCLALAQGDQETGKVVIVHLAVSDSGITETNSSVVYGLPPDCLRGEGDYTYSARASGVVISECGFYDPRVSMGDELDTGGSRSGVVNVAPVGDAVLIFPFNPAMLTLDVMNSTTNESVFHADMSGVARDFCASHPDDVDCAPPATPTPLATEPPATPVPTPAPSGCPLGLALILIAGLGIAVAKK